jgi:hypothetical protein
MAKPTRRRRLRRAVIAAILGLLAPHAVAGPGAKNKKPAKVDVATAKAALLGTDEQKAIAAA